MGRGWGYIVHCISLLLHVATSQCIPHCLLLSVSCSRCSLELDEWAVHVDISRGCEQEAGRGTARLERKSLVGEDIMTAFFQLQWNVHVSRQI